jgi:hypothetical protein
MNDAGDPQVTRNSRGRIYLQNVQNSCRARLVPKSERRPLTRERRNALIYQSMEVVVSNCFHAFTAFTVAPVTYASRRAHWFTFAIRTVHHGRFTRSAEFFDRTASGCFGGNPQPDPPHVP